MTAARFDPSFSLPFSQMLRDNFFLHDWFRDALALSLRSISHHIVIFLFHPNFEDN